MFAGHYAPAYLVRGSSRALPLWSLFVAAQLVDIAFFILAPLRIEGFRVVSAKPGALSVALGPMPYTHSLLMTLVYAAACVAIGAALRRRKAGILFGAVLASHWLCDFVVHTPDLHLGFEAHGTLGLSLWNFPILAFAVEILFVLGCYFWLRRSLRSDKGKRWADIGCAGLVLLQTLQSFVIPPPSTVVVAALSVQGNYAVFVLLAWLVDHYESRHSLG